MKSSDICSDFLSFFIHFFFSIFIFEKMVKNKKVINKLMLKDK